MFQIPICAKEYIPLSEHPVWNIQVVGGTGEAGELGALEIGADGDE